jgi:hypothetical protein
MALFKRAEDVLSAGYDGRDEAVEKDYFRAFYNQALLQLYSRDCDAMDELLHEADKVVDQDSEEKASVALLRGYCLEVGPCELGQPPLSLVSSSASSPGPPWVVQGQGSDKASMYFSLAREYSNNCHETILDASYQPPDYQLSIGLPRSYEYYAVLMDLHVFRELYTQRSALVDPFEGKDSIWTKQASLPKDENGAVVSWGLNEDGVKRANELFEKQDFVVLR